MFFGYNEEILCLSSQAQNRGINRKKPLFDSKSDYCKQSFHSVHNLAVLIHIALNVPSRTSLKVRHYEVLRNIEYKGPMSNVMFVKEYKKELFNFNVALKTTDVYEIMSLMVGEQNWNIM